MCCKAVGMVLISGHIFFSDVNGFFFYLHQFISFRTVKVRNFGIVRYRRTKKNDLRGNYFEAARREEFLVTGSTLRTEFLS